MIPCVIMFPTLAVFGFAATFISLGLCCLPKEYETKDGQCCPMCHEGTVVRRDCTSQSGTRCNSCMNGTFMNQPNGLTKCFPCTACDQGHGLFAQQKCTATTDTICDVLSGYFCKALTDEAGCTLAQKHTRCAPGSRIKEPGTSRTNTVCELCEQGSFSKDGVNCTIWTICSETQVKVKDGSRINDVVCGTASRQYYSYIPFLISTLMVFGLVIAGMLLSRKKLVSSAQSDRHTEQESPG